jgi:hypothetical protein
MHQCFAKECHERVPDHMLMCYVHWQQVPKHLQRRVYRAYDHGWGIGSDEHQKAVQEARKAIAS